MATTSDRSKYLSSPSTISPNTTCFPVRRFTSARAMKNCEEFVFLPVLHIANTPRWSIFNFSPSLSSLNFFPLKIDSPPVQLNEDILEHRSCKTPSCAHRESKHCRLISILKRHSIYYDIVQFKPFQMSPSTGINHRRWWLVDQLSQLRNIALSCISQNLCDKRLTSAIPHHEIATLTDKSFDNSMERAVLVMQFPSAVSYAFIAPNQCQEILTRQRRLVWEKLKHQTFWRHTKTYPSLHTKQSYPWNKTLRMNPLDIYSLSRNPRTTVLFERCIYQCTAGKQICKTVN